MIFRREPPGIYEASDYGVVFMDSYTMTVHKDVMAELSLCQCQQIGIDTLIDVTRFNLAQSEAMRAIKKAQEAARQRAKQDR
jgi:hypothetical protein